MDKREGLQTGMVGIACRTKQYNLEGETALLQGSSGLWGRCLRLEGPAGDEAAPEGADHNRRPGTGGLGRVSELEGVEM